MTTDPLLDLLTRFPKCRVTIGGSSRPKPREGDVKTVRGKRYVRRHRRTGARGVFEGYVEVRNGRPLWDWVQEDAPVGA